MRVSNGSRTPSVIAVTGLLLLPLINGDIVEPLGDSRYRFLAGLAPSDWERLADLSE
jgi:hypothetical protein